MRTVGGFVFLHLPVRIDRILGEDGIQVFRSQGKGPRDVDGGRK
mgnify:CR=1 FL=1